jgi:hypothetical protein
MRHVHFFAFAILVALVGPALAHPPVARVWVNGHDVDGSHYPAHIPGFVSASLWPTNVTGKFLTRGPGLLDARGEVEDVTGVNLTVAGRSGKFRAELDVFTLEQTTTDPLILGGSAFTAGAALKQNDLVLRGSRELYRFDSFFGHYHLDFGLRVTSASRTVEQGAADDSDSKFFLSPELLLHGRWIAGEDFGIHSRLSYATNVASVEREDALEFQVMLNYHTFETGTQVHDLAIGLRVLQTELGFADDVTGQETVITNRYLGPEFTYSVRF